MDKKETKGRKEKMFPEKTVVDYKGYELRIGYQPEKMLDMTDDKKVSTTVKDIRDAIDLALGLGRQLTDCELRHMLEEDDYRF